jgi:hypothetical protein
MAVSDTRPSPGDALVEELKWVHNMIRGDLGTVRRLAAEVAGGLPAHEIGLELDALTTGGPLWQLKINCLRYCTFVHHHHRAESVMLFPALRRANPALGPVVDKLEADHAAVSNRLNTVEQAAQALRDQEDPGVRRALVDGLRALSDELLAHLDYEEEQISGTLRTWKRWPIY